MRAALFFVGFWAVSMAWVVAVVRGLDRLRVPAPWFGLAFLVLWFPVVRWLARTSVKLSWPNPPRRPRA